MNPLPRLVGAPLALTMADQREEPLALVVFLRGLNVGGHRRFRPSMLAAYLQHLDAVNIGATGTFVIRRPVSRTQLRAEITRRLPFVAEIMICDGREIVGLLQHKAFAGHPARPGVVRFVSVLQRRPRSAPRLPIRLPARGEWLLQVLARDGRYVFGLYRRRMKVIRYLGMLDEIFGVPATTRNWNTIAAVAKVITPSRGDRRSRRDSAGNRRRPRHDVEGLAPRRRRR